MNVWRIKDSFLWVYRSFDSANYAGRSRYFDRTVVARNTNLNGHFILPFWSGYFAQSGYRESNPDNSCSQGRRLTIKPLARVSTF